MNLPARPTTLLTALLSAALTLVPLAARAEDAYGTPAQASEMLDRLVAGLRQDRDKTLQIARSGGNDYRQLDLYPFCGDDKGNFLLHPQLEGKSMRGIVDSYGKPVGKLMYDRASEGKIEKMQYMWPRYVGPSQVMRESPKNTFYTKVGTLVCGVGAYRLDGAGIMAGK